MEKLRNLNSGLGQFCFHLGNALAGINPTDLGLHFYLPKVHDKIFGNSFQYLSHSQLHKFLPATSQPMDVWHCTHQLSKYLPPSRRTKLLLTIHDLNFLRKYDRIKRKFYLSRLQRKVDRANGIVAISKFTENEVREHLRLHDKPVKLIYIGTSLRKFPSPRKPEFVPPGKFIFTIGILSAKKNFHSLLPMLQKTAEYSLIIAGDNTTAYAQEIKMQAKRLNISERVIMPGIISDEEKYWLYQNCEALAFPSLSEGFGSPVIEAMSCGKPVFLSTLASLPEIGGDVAYYFPSFDPEEMSTILNEGLSQFYADPSAAQKSIHHAAQFSWDKAAKQYLDLYRNI